MPFTLLQVLPIILILVHEVEKALTFELAETITSVTLNVVTIAGHCPHTGTTSRNTPE